VPDNRQSSKQKRAARNRAVRDARAARRENALASRSATDDAAVFSGAGASGDAGAATTGAPEGVTRTGRAGGRRPGDTAVLLALLLAAFSAVITVVRVRVPVDDRGEPLPTRFRGAAVQAREMLTGQTVGDQSTSLLDAQGPGILLVLALPVLVCVYAFWANRRPDRSRMLTFAMLALAATVILGGGILFLPSLIALAIASFQVRKAELPARMASRGTRRDGTDRAAGDDGDVIDLESEEVTPGDGSQDSSGWTPGR
jgi:hypothetical protein